MSVHVLPIGSDDLVEVAGLKRHADDTWVNDATVTVTLTDEGGGPIPGAIDVAMSHVAGSDGKYQGTLPYTVTAGLVQGKSYWLWVLAVSVAGRPILYDRRDCVANYEGN